MTGKVPHQGRDERGVPVREVYVGLFLFPDVWELNGSTPFGVPLHLTQSMRTRERVR